MPGGVVFAEMGDRKAELVAALKANRDETIGALRRLTVPDLAQGRYENGWNGLQILAHIAAIEWTYPRLLEVGRMNQAADAGAAPAVLEARGGIDAYNARQVERRAGIAATGLIAEWERNREALIAAVEATTEESLARPVRSAGGDTGDLSVVIRSVAIEHVRGHVADLFTS